VLTLRFQIFKLMASYTLRPSYGDGRETEVLTQAEGRARRTFMPAFCPEDDKSIAELRNAWEGILPDSSGTPDCYVGISGSL
jgi:hypothetical protein